MAKTNVPNPDLIKPKLTLIGTDGNSFAILGRARTAARQAHWSGQKLKQYMDEATSGDYDHLLRITMKYFEVN